VGTYNGIAFLKGNGKGTFQNPVYSNSTIQFCCQMVAGDVNGDGKLDLINDANGYVSALVMLGNGDGTFQPPSAYSAGGQVYSGNIVVGDFNSDGIGDVGMVFQNSYSGVTVASLYLSVPAINLFPTAVNFGSEPVGQTSPPTNIQVTNLGNAKLSISSMAITGDFLEQNNCGNGLAIGGSCTLQVSFKPTAKGKRTGAVTIKDNAIANPQRISLKGIGQ
jgi:hypothetical protein